MCDISAVGYCTIGAYIFRLHGLVVLAFVGLTSWPFGPLSALVSSSSLYGFVVAFSGYAWLLCALFWASAPGVAAQRFVFSLGLLSR